MYSDNERPAPSAKGGRPSTWDRKDDSVPFTGLSQKHQGHVEPGAIFGAWTVLTVSDPTGRRSVCRCECSAIRAVATADLAAGLSTSCGCQASQLLQQLAREVRAAKQRRHD